MFEDGTNLLKQLLCDSPIVGEDEFAFLTSRIPMAYYLPARSSAFLGHYRPLLHLSYMKLTPYHVYEAN